MKPKNIKIVLVGQPNVGKSMLINSLSNSKLKVGNFAGVTVEKKEVTFNHKGYEIQIIDLPGTYSLNNYSIEEKITKNFLENSYYDIILNIVDSTNLQRNLLLTYELLDLNKKMIVTLNMCDEADDEKIFIDEKKLSSLINKPCVKTSAAKKIGVTKLLDEIINLYENDISTSSQFFPKEQNQDEIFNKKFAFVNSLVSQTVKCEKGKVKTKTDKLDSILMNKFLGLPIFLFFIWSLFQLTFTLGSIPMDMIDAFFTNLIDSTKEFLGDNEISSIIADGAIAGVGAVILFLPNIIILFFGIALLETTGYISRVAFLLDGFLHKFGLHGKSFIPLVTGFGCSVPAYMAARTLKNEKDRLLTLFIIGFMSCGAKLPVYVLFIGAFFQGQSAGNILFIIYISGAILGLFAAKILRVVVFKNEDDPFVMEIPKYRVPSAKLIYHTVLNQAMMYVKKAGTFILAASIIIWFMSNYPKHEEVTAQYEQKIELAVTDEDKQSLENELSLYNLENSYLGWLGKVSEPLFRPLGFDWKMSVALETGLAAKEVVVSTLSILYGLGEDNDENSQGLMEKIRANIPLTSAIAFIVFVMIYLPCVAASMVFMRESGSWKYLWYLFLFTTTTAYILSFVAYNVTKMLVS